MKLDNTLERGLQFVLVRHDAWCPGAHGDGYRCICNPVTEFVDEKTWLDSVARTRTRAQRRAAARAARKARRGRD